MSNRDRIRARLEGRARTQDDKEVAVNRFCEAIDSLLESMGVPPLFNCPWCRAPLVEDRIEEDGTQVAVCSKCEWESRVSRV